MMICTSPSMVQESAQAMDKPDLQSAVAQGANFFWLFEVVPGRNSNTFANQIIFQSDKPNGIWFAPDGAAATWRPAWWRITQEPDTITMCFVWRDCVQANVRRDFKMLLPLSPDGRWNRLLPIQLQQTVLDQFHAFTAWRDEAGMQEQSELTSKVLEAA